MKYYINIQRIRHWQITGNCHHCHAIPSFCVVFTDHSIQVSFCLVEGEALGPYTFIAFYRALNRLQRTTYSYGPLAC